jgi:hypothetical protein
MNLVNVVRRHTWEDKVEADRIRAVDHRTIGGRRRADMALNDPRDGRQGIHLYPEVSTLGFSQIRLKPEQNNMGEHA